MALDNHSADPDAAQTSSAVPTALLPPEAEALNGGKDPLGFRVGHRRVFLCILVLAAILAVSLVAGIVIGSVNIPLSTTLDVL